MTYRYRIETVNVPEPRPGGTSGTADQGDESRQLPRRIVHVLGAEANPRGGLDLQVLTEESGPA